MDYHRKATSNALKVNTKLVITLSLSLLFVFLSIQMNRHWLRESATGYRIMAHAPVCLMIDTLTTQEGDEPFCIFEAHVEKSPFSSGYTIWVNNGLQTREISLPENQVISIERLQGEDDEFPR